MKAIHESIEFLGDLAWLIWPIALLTDILISKLTEKESKINKSRGFFRALHSLSLMAFVINGLGFFWIKVIKIHYHGYWESFIIGPLVFYLSLRFSQRFDKQITEYDETNSILAFALPSVCGFFLLLACISSITRSINFLTDREYIFIFIVPFLSLISIGCLFRCKKRKQHIILLSSLAFISLLFTIVFFIASDFKFFGFLPWGYANDDPWFYVLTGFVCFSILTISSIINKKEKPNQENALDSATASLSDL